VLDKTVAVTARRIDACGGRLVGEQRCAHAVDDLAARIRAVSADLVLIAGASAITDRRDVLPAAIEAAGGVVEHFGMPVDPGNLLLLARQGGRPVLGLPGCARSPKLNGFDWVLQRLAAGLPVERSDIMAMGVGGLLMEIRGVGLAFQIADDLLDAETDGACSLVSVLGAPAARERAEALLASALARLQDLGTRAEPLRQLARYAVRRDA
jgi:molybdopterin biosynthesis enzyme